MNWTDILATRTARTKASKIRELLKLLDQPDILSFAGGSPDPALFPKDAFAAAYAEVLSGPRANPPCNTPSPKATSPSATGSPTGWPPSASPVPPTTS